MRLKNINRSNYNNDGNFYVDYIFEFEIRILRTWREKESLIDSGKEYFCYIQKSEIVKDWFKHEMKLFSIEFRKQTINWFET